MPTMPTEVEILDAKVQTLLQAQPGPIEQGHHDPHRPPKMCEDLVHFVSAEDHRNAMREPRLGHLFDRANLHAQDMTIEKPQGA